MIWIKLLNKDKEVLTNWIAKEGIDETDALCDFLNAYYLYAHPFRVGDSIVIDEIKEN